MPGLVRNAAPFYPPHVRPSAGPLRFPFNLARILVNNLTAIPEQAYREEIVIAPGPPRMAFITGVELLKTLLMSHHLEFPKGRLQNETLRPLFGNAMISSEGREWRWQRAAAAPLFRYDELLQYGPIMTAAAEATVAKWRAASPGTVHVIDNDMMHAAFEVISKTMLVGGAPGVIHAIEKGHADYYKGVNWWAIYTMFGLPHWLPRPGGRQMRAHERRLRKAVGDLVKGRRGAGMGGEADLLGRMLAVSDLETGRTMSDELIVDNVLSFLMAGYDTTAFSLAWTLYLISQSPEWDARMLEEIDRVVGPGPVTAAHVTNLVVVQQVLNESLRLFPTAPVIIRDFDHDTELGGITIPARTVGIIPIYAIHRHRNYWDDPHRFDPDRFSPERPSKPTRYQFMPFGAGPRICMGASFAMIEVTVMLATFVRAARFEVDPSFDPQPTGRMFLLPKNGMPMRVTLRDSVA
jgi:cytochrome P450